MSPLWPDTVHVGLFAGASWLKLKRVKDVQPFNTTPDPEPGALLCGLEGALDTLAEKLRKGSRVVVTVSDTVAAITAMSWQPSLSRTEELNSYARVCFEKLGMAIDADWAMYAEFRHYGAMGLAYALPNAWLARLVELLEARGLILQTVLPASARAYAYRLSRRLPGKNLILMQEMFRSSAMLLGSEGLCGYDVEPVIGACRESSIRLLKRTGVRHEDIGRVIHWSLDSLEDKPLPGFVTTWLAGSTCQAMAPDIWER